MKPAVLLESAKRRLRLSSDELAAIERTAKRLSWLAGSEAVRTQDVAEAIQMSPANRRLRKARDPKAILPDGDSP